MSLLLFLLFILSSVFFLYLFFTDRRTILIGSSLVVAGTSFILGLALIYRNNQLSFSNIFVQVLLLPLLIFLSILLFIGPFIITFIFLSNGVKIIQHEGLAFRNLLSFGVGLLLLYQILFSKNILASLPQDSILYFLYIYLGILSTFFYFLASSYVLSSLLNFFHLRKKKFDYIVVLGAGLRQNRVTPLLGSRINKGIKIYKKHSQAKLILSGGKGPDEAISEALAMAEYAKDKGVPATDIIMEDQSTNTRENIVFSARLMGEKRNFALVTNYYHIFRALLLAKEEGIDCTGYGARTKFYFTMNAFVREFFGYLSLRRGFVSLSLFLISLVYFKYLIIRIFIL